MINIRREITNAENKFPIVQNSSKFWYLLFENINTCSWHDDQLRRLLSGIDILPSEPAHQTLLFIKWSLYRQWYFPFILSLTK